MGGIGEVYQAKDLPLNLAEILKYFPNVDGIEGAMDAQTDVKLFRKFKHLKYLRVWSWREDAKALNDFFWAIRNNKTIKTLNVDIHGQWAKRYTNYLSKMPKLSMLQSDLNVQRDADKIVYLFKSKSLKTLYLEPADVIPAKLMQAFKKAKRIQEVYWNRDHNITNDEELQRLLRPRLFHR